MNIPVVKQAEDPYAAFERIAGEEGGGRIVKFTKDGRWSVGADEEDVTGTTVVVDMAGLIVGWRKWIDSKIVAIDAGYAFDGFRPKARDEIGDTDETQWPRNARGERNDPWQFGYALRLSSEDGELFTWHATSGGAKRAVGDLCRSFVRKRTNPYVKLAASFYRHKEFGRVNVPALEVVDWSAPEPALSSPARPRGIAENPAPAPLDDDIPF